MQGEQEAIDIINARPKPLAAYVFTTNKAVEERMVKNVSSGGMVVNDTVMHVSVSETTASLRILYFFPCDAACVKTWALMSNIVIFKHTVR